MLVGHRRFVGVDLGADALHAVVVTSVAGGTPTVSACRTFHADDLATLVKLCRGAAEVAIDAPDALSLGPHVDDLRLKPKFRTGRCSDVASSGRGGGPAVPWVTPMAGMPVPSWMATGFQVWAELRRHGHDPMEVFPAGCFYRLNGGRWPERKTTSKGRSQRIALLRHYVALPKQVEMWSHDGIDALVAALVAHQGRRLAVAIDHHCGSPDGSRLWYLAVEGAPGPPHCSPPEPL
jgi:hypothetical protein